MPLLTDTSAAFVSQASRGLTWTTHQCRDHAQRRIKSRGFPALHGMPVNTTLKVPCLPHGGTGKPILHVNKIYLDSDSQGGSLIFFLPARTSCRNLPDNLFHLRVGDFLCVDARMAVDVIFH